jgi:hypothetical protein
VKICSSSCLSWFRLLKSWSLRQSRGGSFRMAPLLRVSKRPPIRRSPPPAGCNGCHCTSQRE